MLEEKPFSFSSSEELCTKQNRKNLLPWGNTILLLSLEWEILTLMTLPLNQSLCHIGVAPDALYPNVSFGGS